MARNNPRKWPCVDCRTPKTATRVGTRCPTCSVAHMRRQDVKRTERVRTDYDRHLARLAKARQLQAKRRADAKAARQATRAHDAAAVTAIDLYRAEKAKRAARIDAERAAQIADARRMIALYVDPLSKGKPGRPRKVQAA